MREMKANPSKLLGVITSLRQNDEQPKLRLKGYFFTRLEAIGIKVWLEVKKVSVVGISE